MGDAVALVVIAVILLAGALAFIRVQAAQQALKRDQRQLARKRQEEAEQAWGREQAELNSYLARINRTRSRSQLDKIVRREQERRN